MSLIDSETPLTPEQLISKIAHLRASLAIPCRMADIEQLQRIAAEADHIAKTVAGYLMDRGRLSPEMLEHLARDADQRAREIAKQLIPRSPDYPG